MDTPLITALVNLPALNVVGGGRPYQIYEGANTIQAAYLTATIAGVLATDAEVDAQILGVEVRDGDAVLIDWFTPAELRNVYDHFHSKYGAKAADSGVIPIIHLPDNYPLSMTSAHFGLGRLADDKSGLAKYKITVLWAAIPTIDLLLPTVIVDPTEFAAPMGRHLRLERFASTWAGATAQVIPDLFRDSNALFCHELWFDTSTDVIATISVRQGNENRMLDCSVAVLDYEMHRAGGVLVVDRQIIPFNTLNDPSSNLQIAGKAPVVVTPVWAGAPAAYDVLKIMEYEGRVPA